MTKKKNKPRLVVRLPRFFVPDEGAEEGDLWFEIYAGVLTKVLVIISIGGLALLAGCHTWHYFQ
jgi:hypothetical protein